MDPARLAIAVGADQLQLPAFVRDHEYPVVARAELRRSRPTRHQFRCTAADGHAIDAGVFRIIARGEVSALPLFEHDGVAIGGELRIAVMTRLRGHHAFVTTVRADRDDAAQVPVVPAHEGDARPVARPRRERLDRIVVARGQPPRSAACGWLHVELAQRFEYDAAPVG